MTECAAAQGSGFQLPRTSRRASCFFAVTARQEQRWSAGPDKRSLIGHHRSDAAKSNGTRGLMARSSPGVRRIVAILNFFADHPGQSFTLTNLVRALKLSRATCHALLAGLVESGYLYRTQDKSYVIGPTLVSIGRIAQQHLSPLQVAQPEMRALADEFDAICSAIFREGDDAIVRARAAALSHLGWSSPQGARLLLRAPFSAVYFAWGPKAEADAWLAQAVPAPTLEQRGAMFEAMAFAREHGFCFFVRNPRVPELRNSPASAFSGERTEFPVILPSVLEPDHDYELTSVVSPVFDENRQVVFVLGLMGFPDRIRGVRIEHIGKRLREACDRITNFIVGSPPPPQSSS
jgi:DNA-binding IclR family transcriptional regulator